MTLKLTNSSKYLRTYNVLTDSLIIKDAIFVRKIIEIEPKIQPVIENEGVFLVAKNESGKK